MSHQQHYQSDTLYNLWWQHFDTMCATTHVTCHDPHGRPLPEKPEYEKKCQSCHAPASLVTSKCPRSENTQCLGCHMVKATPLPGLTFTDHRIRVYREGLQR